MRNPDGTILRDIYCSDRKRDSNTNIAPSRRTHCTGTIRKKNTINLKNTIRKGRPWPQNQ